MVQTPKPSRLQGADAQQEQVNGQQYAIEPRFYWHSGSIPKDIRAASLP
jgi:hypothetical protein